jgi:hypothetical protein
MYEDAHLEMAYEDRFVADDYGPHDFWGEDEPDDEDDEDFERPLCMHGLDECNAPECTGNVLLSEVRDAELWGGTE